MYPFDKLRVSGDECIAMLMTTSTEPAAPSKPAARGWARLPATFGLVKIEHTLFALPFALLGAFEAARGFPTVREIALILLAMIGARSAAMAFNRLVDAPYDAANPRTAGRHLPAGVLSRAFVAAFTVAAAALLVGAAYLLNPLAFALSPLALGLVFFYSFTKRFTWGSHFVLGAALALAPLGAWIAVAGNVSALPLLLGAAVACWTAGFDILYALQDLDFDRRAGLFSVPARFGAPGALALARLAHAAMLVFLGAFAWRAGHGAWGAIAVLTAAILLVWQHRQVGTAARSRAGSAGSNAAATIERAFLWANALLAPVVVALFLLDIIQAP